MGVVEADLDGDGKLDLDVANFRDEYTTVYCRRAYGFQDRSSALGVTLLTRPFTGFGLAALDLDCDGVDEIIQANGRVTQLDSPTGLTPLPTGPATEAKLRIFWDAYAERSLVLCRVGPQYVDASDEAGDFGRWIGVGRGLAVGDIDGDGRPDLVALDLADRARVFLNRAEKRGRWISVRAVDSSKGGRDMLGTLVTVVLPERRLSRRIRTCGSYQSASEPRAFFGLGDAARVERIELVWPDGDLAPESFAAPKLDHAYTLIRSQGTGKR